MYDADRNPRSISVCCVLFNRGGPLVQALVADGVQLPCNPAVSTRIARVSERQVFHRTTFKPVRYRRSLVEYSNAAFAAIVLTASMTDASSL
jgi:hypothetical protein